MTVEFVAWGKTPRLYRTVTITEKIDGTNGCVIVELLDPEDYPVPHPPGVVIDPADGKPYRVTAQSRKRIITPEDDNYGFATWVRANATDLANMLGAGRHYGEWWGQGIQRGYGMKNKVFSLFNTRRFGKAEFTHPELRMVPVLYRGTFDVWDVDIELDKLRRNGSVAAPGYMNPEGVCVFHEDAGQVFKVLLENDDIPKSVAALKVAA